MPGPRGRQHARGRRGRVGVGGADVLGRDRQLGGRRHARRPAASAGRRRPTTPSRRRCTADSPHQARRISGERTEQHQQHRRPGQEAGPGGADAVPGRDGRGEHDPDGQRSAQRPRMPRPRSDRSTRGRSVGRPARGAACAGRESGESVAVIRARGIALVPTGVATGRDVREAHRAGLREHRTSGCPVAARPRTSAAAAREPCPAGGLHRGASLQRPNPGGAVAKADRPAGPPTGRGRAQPGQRRPGPADLQFPGLGGVRGRPG